VTCCGIGRSGGLGTDGGPELAQALISKAKAVKAVRVNRRVCIRGLGGVGCGLEGDLVGGSDLEGDLFDAPQGFLTAGSFDAAGRGVLLRQITLLLGGG